jgi:hypothetical protein
MKWGTSARAGNIDPSRLISIARAHSRQSIVDACVVNQNCQIRKVLKHHAHKSFYLNCARYVGDLTDHPLLIARRSTQLFLSYGEDIGITTTDTHAGDPRAQILPCNL